jgi:hypothetical protein
MEPRLNLFGSSIGPSLFKYINSAGKVVSDSTLPHATQELVKIRASHAHQGRHRRRGDLGAAEPGGDLA